MLEFYMYGCTIYTKIFKIAVWWSALSNAKSCTYVIKVKYVIKQTENKAQLCCRAFVVSQHNT